jgi:predicted dienelactone hydrolase
MRPFEILTFAFLIPSTLSWLWTGPRVSNILRLLCALAVASLLIHVFVEGPHWQLAPLYLAVVLVSVNLFGGSGLSLLTRRSLSVLSLALILGSVALSYALPMFRLPRPSGPYAVGTTIIQLEDAGRTEIHANPPGKSRRILVQVWYPAADSRGRLAPYRRWPETTKLASYMAVLKTHSHLNAPVSAQGSPFPVLLFNPSWQGQRTQSTFQTEDLASHGFVVAAIDHPYITGPIAFSDGEIIRPDRSLSLGDFRRNSVQEVIAIGAAETEYETKDDIFVLDYLQQLNQDRQSRFYGRLDFNSVGAFGHSFGGAVALETAYRDSRVLAALNMDGWIFGEVSEAGINKPYMQMSDDEPLPTEVDLRSSNLNHRGRAELNFEDSRNVDRSLSRFGGYRLKIRGAGHMNFTDRTIYSPIRKFSEAGSIDPRRAQSIVEDYTLAFFSKYLKGSDELLLEQEPSPYREVEFKIWASHPSPQP